MHRVVGTGYQRYVSMELVLLFWSFSLYDIYLPKQKYEGELKRVKDATADLAKPISIKTGAKKTAQAAALEKFEAEKDRRIKLLKVKLTTDELTKEYSEQQKHVSSVHGLFREFKDSFLQGTDPCDVPDIVDYFVQDLIHKRALMSPIDAVTVFVFFHTP